MYVWYFLTMRWCISSFLAQKKAPWCLGHRFLQSGAGVSKKAQWGFYWEWRKLQTGTNCNHLNHGPSPDEMHCCATLRGTGCKDPVPLSFSPPVSLQPPYWQSTTGNKQVRKSAFRISAETRVDRFNQGDDRRITSSVTINKQVPHPTPPRHSLVMEWESFMSLADNDFEYETALAVKTLLLGLKTDIQLKANLFFKSGWKKKISLYIALISL